MMDKKIVFFFIFLAFCCAAVWSAGSKENESRVAEEPGGFTDFIDINEKTPGKYNFYYEARDKAGNISLVGPDNLYVDPESDLPRVTIINPMPNMRVQGNLNIVGIAADDDGVNVVELVISRGKDGKGEELVRVRADGSEYWSYFLNTTNSEIWTDGVYTITAWAVDINGLSGISEDFKPKAHKKHQVFWNLDRRKPETEVTSHEVGALVSGNVRMRGNVIDGNGIDAFSYSVDGGNRYIPSKFGYDKRTGVYTWDVTINTKLFDDGPAVIWFKAKDGQGSVGTGAHLLFVNNTPPDVKIVYPQPDTVVNGIFPVSGYASHPVGLKSVSWKADKATGEFDLVIGNPWWSVDIDLRGIKTSSVDVEIRAVDVSGNVTVKKQKYKVDQSADLPAVTLSAPAANAVIGEDGSLVVKGSASDDDGVYSVLYSINAGSPVEVLTNGYFQFIIPELPPGNNVLDLWAKDITGVTGPKVQVKGISYPGPLPEPGIVSFSAGSGKNAVITPFYTGVTISPEVKLVMDMAINSATLASASVVFGDSPPIVARASAGKDGIFRASVPVPTNLRPGFTKIELRATDRYGRSVTFNEYVFANSTAGYSFDWIRPNMTPDGRIMIGSNLDVLLGVAPERLSRVDLSGPGAENVFAEVDEFGRVKLQARREGDFGPLTLSLGSSESRPFRILADFSGPSISLREAPREGSWVQTSVPVTFNVSGANRISAVGYSLDMGESWQSLLSETELAALSVPVNRDIPLTLDLSHVQDGCVTILLRATSESGRDSTEVLTVLKDTQVPEAELIIPIADERVNGTILMGFAVKETGKLKSVRYHRPAYTDAETGARKEEINAEVFSDSQWEKEYAVIFLDVLMESLQMPLDENMRFIFEDEAGNMSEVNYWPFVIDTEMDIPVAHVILPLENEVITTDFLVSGVMFDDDAIKQIYWFIDEGTERELVAENGFSIPIALSSLTDNEHSVTVIAEDIYGVRSEPVTRGFRVSLSEPMAEILHPSFDTILRDIIEISGTSYDENGIEELQISIDNGNTFNTVYGTTEWYYSFNTRILKDGPHVVFIRVWDCYGIPATYSSMINVDNTPPEVSLDSPGDGSVSVGKIPIIGRALDPNLELVTIELRSLQGAAIREDLQKRTLGPDAIIKETLDLLGQVDGLYNVEIVAADFAGNITRISRNVDLARESMKNFVEILYPLENENVQGVFNLYGYTGGTDPAGSVTVRINGIDLSISQVEDSGYFRFSLDSSLLANGENKIIVHSNFGGYDIVTSPARTLVYKADGPWVTIDSMNIGDFAFERPYLFGRTGYELSFDDQAVLADKKADKELRAEILKKVPSFTEISFDNGKSFVKTNKSISKNVDYRYRLETGEMTEGMHYILIRTTMKNEETVITRILVQVDKTAPVIRLISPEAGGHYNQEMSYSASATDDVELESLSYFLRKGDKSLYEIPGFIQGLYFEGIIPPFIRQLSNDMPVMPFGGGATYMDVGMGLSFFDDNVKIQIQYGFLTQELYESLGGTGPVRYGGHVLGLKILASVYTLPFGSFAGPDWEWLFASFAIGANFSLFDLAQQGYTQSGKSTWMSALLLQIEFPRVTIPKRKYLRTFSLFTEGQLWFVPTDVDAEVNKIETIIPHIIMGLRLYIF